MPTLRPRKPRPEEPAPNNNNNFKSTKSKTSAVSNNNNDNDTTDTLKRRRAPKPSASSSTRNEKQQQQPSVEMNSSTGSSSAPDEERPLLDGGSSSRRDGGGTEEGVEALSWARRNEWIVFALASGGCAAFNGVFAKLTTTELTARLSLGIARLLGLERVERVVEFVVRGSFFGLNLVFNGVMWTLFTTALAKGNSTTQVSIMNTSSNFVITAMLGFVIFSEALPPLWWLGAAMLVAGNVVIGRKDEGKAEEAEDVKSVNETAVLLPSGGDSVVTAASGSRGQVDGADEEEMKDEDEDEDEDAPELRRGAESES